MHISFYIARRYFLSRKNTNAVNIITLIAIGGLSIATMALCVILVVFSGLKDLNINIYQSINPDIKILPSNGKDFSVNEDLLQKIHTVQGVEALSQTIEEKVYLRYRERDHLAYLKGVDINYEKVINFQQHIVLGNPISSSDPGGIIAGIKVAQHLSLVLEDWQNPIKIFVPRPGKGQIIKASFIQKNAIAIGIFNILEEVNERYVYGHLSFVQELINKGSNIYALELKVVSQVNIDVVKNALIKILGPGYIVKTRAEQQETLFKIMNTENFIIYLILSLVTLITSFNLIGAITILKLDKREQNYTLCSLGLTILGLKKIFIYTGLTITLIGWIVGILEGYTLAFIQYKYAWITINETTAFPVKFTINDFLLTTITVWTIGLCISYFSSRKMYLSSE
ncbi:MAG: ABC transporter permease [Flavobacteriales bacterium AspAUS03]